jgi:hypothetical protein
MGDLTQDVRDAAGALAALVPHAVSFGEGVADSIKTACELVEPTLAKEELVIAVVGEAGAKRALLRNVLGADAIVGPKARKERTIRIRARGAYDYTAHQNDSHAIRFARNVPDRDPLYRRSIDQAEERVRVAKVSREALAAQVERTRGDVRAIEANIVALENETETMGETFASAWRAHKAAEMRLAAIEKVVPDVPEIFRTTPAWWAIWIWIMRWMTQSKWREPVAHYEQNRAEAAAAKTRAHELEAVAKGTEDTREDLKRRRVAEDEGLERAHAALAAVEVALAEERGVADAEKHLDQLVRDQAKYAGERQGEFFADIHDFDETARGDDIGDIDVELPLDHPNAPPPGVVLVVAPETPKDADACLRAGLRGDRPPGMPCVASMEEIANDKAGLLAAACAFRLRACILQIATARRNAEAAHEKRLASLESQRIPHPDEFRAKQIEKSEPAIDKGADEIVAAARQKLGADIAAIEKDWIARIEGANGRREIERAIDDVNQRGKIGVLESLEAVSELVAREMQSHGETIERFALDEIQSSYRTQKRMRAESLAPVASEVTGEDLAEGIATLVPIPHARNDFRRRRTRITTGGIVLGTALGAGAAVAVHHWFVVGIGAALGVLAFFATPTRVLRRDALSCTRGYIAELSRKSEANLAAKRQDVALGLRASLDEALGEALRRINDAITRLMTVEKNAIEAERATLANLAKTRGTLEDHDARLRAGLEPFTSS